MHEMALFAIDDESQNLDQSGVFSSLYLQLKLPCPVRNSTTNTNKLALLNCI